MYMYVYIILCTARLQIGDLDSGQNLQRDAVWSLILSKNVSLGDRYYYPGVEILIL